MKLITSLSFIAFVFLNCGRNAPEQEVQQEEMVHIYQQLDLDTIRQGQALKMYEKDYQLEISKYCRNDSSLVIASKNNDPKTTTIAHNYVSRIKLNRGEEKVLDIEIDKAIFKDSLDTEFYKLATIREVEYESVRSNRLYFKAILAVPDTDRLYQARFGIFYQTNKKGRLGYWGVGNKE